MFLWGAEMCVLPGPRISLEVGYEGAGGAEDEEDAATREATGVEATGVAVAWGPAARRALYSFFDSIRVINSPLWKK